MGRRNATKAEGMKTPITSTSAGSSMPLLLLLLLVLTPTYTLADDPRQDAMTSVLREVTGQLERFNSLYINKLERELSASAARMAALEATVRSVADRAAAWDNIQNHMAVWTDQSRTMERKLDLLNRCHEKQASWEERLSAVDALNHKLTALDKKINAMTRLEFKVEQVSERVEEVDSTVKWVKKRMGAPDHPVLTQFAGRGVLSSLLSIEHRLGNLSRRIADGGVDVGAAGGAGGGGTPLSSYIKANVFGSRGGRPSRPPVEPEPGVSFPPHEHARDLRGGGGGGVGGVGECVLHPQDSRRLQDVSAKVDLVFDRLTDPDYEYDYFVSQVQQRAAPLHSAPQRQEEDEDTTPEHLFARFWKSMFAPFKNLKRRLRGFETQLTSVHRSCNESAVGGQEAAAAVGRGLAPLGEVRQAVRESRQAMTDHTTALHKVAQSVSQVSTATNQVLAEVQRGFQELGSAVRDGFRVTHDVTRQYCTGDSRQPATPPPPPPPSPPPPSPPPPPTLPSTSNGGRDGDYGGRDEVVRRAGGRTRDCSDLLAEGNTRSGVYSFTPSALHRASYGHDYYTRYCDQGTGGGGWTVVQRRGLPGPPYHNFTEDWYGYKDGFGDLTREFWWGNDNIHRLTQEQRMMIRFDLWDFEGNHAFAEYLSFSVGAEHDNYRLQVYDYRGNASDSFSAHNDYLFSTYDRDNDEAPECCPCAPAYGGGWWFYSCFESNLNGEYHTRPSEHQYRGIIWEMWLGDYSLRATEMKVRPASFSFSSRASEEPSRPQPPPPPPPPTYPPSAPGPYPTLPELPLRQP
ncbi:uncharacterized protein LOC127008350 isoform X2 [Eriocheir sinensis]|uniref:uncharacterized protein LOC127008350 isoform X2 n=1 Tax=Eriocheir sinensis TaxID=95602 RepID=UPI0021C8745A|nr:uncharacterized protein LOC127008350 isoform X2 [Eriocheir sinensis]